MSQEQSTGEQVDTEINDLDSVMAGLDVASSTSSPESCWEQNLINVGAKMRRLQISLSNTKLVVAALSSIILGLFVWKWIAHRNG